jgi:hypothetical protein
MTMGIVALSTSTTEVMIAGNQRIAEMNRISADGGKDIASPIIEDCIYYDRTDTGKFPVIKDTSLNSELLVDDSGTHLSEYTNYSHEELNNLERNSDNVTAAGNHDTTDALSNPDINYGIPTNNPTVTVKIDIDRLFASVGAGSAIEFGSATEGAGKGVGSGGGRLYLKVNSFTQGQTGSGGEVGSLYRYVFK